MAAAVHVQVPGTAPFSANEPWQTDPIYVNANYHKHLKDICKPCIYTKRTVGCRNGDLCTFCHYQHDRPPRRPTKSKRQQIQKIAKDCVDKSPDNQKFFESLAKTSCYMAKVLEATLIAAG
jgi:hypothetical protein